MIEHSGMRGLVKDAYLARALAAPSEHPESARDDELGTPRATVGRVAEEPCPQRVPVQNGVGSEEALQDISAGCNRVRTDK